jgi:hypothetical protein
MLSVNILCVMFDSVMLSVLLQNVIVLSVVAPSIDFVL